MDFSRDRRLDAILETFQNDFSLSQLIVTVLSEPRYGSHPTVRDLLANTDGIVHAFSLHKSSHSKLLDWASDAVKEECAGEIRELVKVESGWHFSALHAKSEQIENFRIEEMALKIEADAPRLWALLDVLLSARMTKKAQVKSGGDVVMSGGVPEEWESEDSEYWAQVDDLEGIIDGITGNQVSRAAKLDFRRQALITLRKVVIVSILKKSTNQKANSLSGMLGLFLHSTHAPEKVIETMAQIGLSISVDAIHDAIHSLSAQSGRALQCLGQSLLAAYAYDNFDINLKSTVPTAQKSVDTLKHLTSGLLFPLQHGVTLDDLKCSYELWKKSRINPYAESCTAKTWKDLLAIHQESHHPSNLSRRDRFNSWKFLQDLCHHGPAYFAQFKSQIRDPDVIDQIPVVKTPVVAASAMDVNNSTVAGNIQAIEKLMAQGYDLLS
ncbi:hypothetical protein BV22DRAFT_1129691 [Leucogyrophana mollusca]|uniref:Uncharacterized protein n=1 Tax=Leucogyrophana mollusca TaxID=85980 RepID=A0ACB8BGL7_9AGAM|nr:hypothetical protein BV22DRAFT_1129691 [Leucogyrophana mollusca]